jgi:hypothetical protein
LLADRETMSHGLVAEMHSVGDFLRQQVNASGTNADGMLDAHCSTMSLKIANMHDLDAVLASALSQAVHAGPWKDLQNARLITAIDERLRAPPSKKKKLPNQSMQSFNLYLKDSSIARMTSLGHIDEQLEFAAELCAALRLKHPHEPTVGHSVSVVCTVCDHRPWKKTTLHYVHQFKGFLNTKCRDLDVRHGYIDTYPVTPAGLPKSLYDAVYGDEAPSTREWDMSGQVHCIVRKSHKEAQSAEPVHRAGSTDILQVLLQAMSGFQGQGDLPGFKMLTPRTARPLPPASNELLRKLTSLALTNGDAGDDAAQRQQLSDANADLSPAKSSNSTPPASPVQPSFTPPVSRVSKCGVDRNDDSVRSFFSYDDLSAVEQKAIMDSAKQAANSAAAKVTAEQQAKVTAEQHHDEADASAPTGRGSGRGVRGGRGGRGGRGRGKGNGRGSGNDHGNSSTQIVEPKAKAKAKAACNVARRPAANTNAPSPKAACTPKAKAKAKVTAQAKAWPVGCGRCRGSPNGCGTCNRVGYVPRWGPAPANR